MASKGLRDRVRSLEESNRENRRIIAALTSRIPAIEAPPDERGSPETAREERERAERAPSRDGRDRGGRKASVVA
jgi:hypothetical protein